MRYVRETFMTEPTRFWEVEPDTWWMVIDINVNGPFLMARAVAPHLIRTGWGRIINVSGNHSTMRRPGFSPYGPSKAALESETLIWAQDLRGTGVTVNALLPGGATLTGMIPDVFPANARGTLLDPGIMMPPLLWLVKLALLHPGGRDSPFRGIQADFAPLGGTKFARPDERQRGKPQGALRHEGATVGLDRPH